MKWTERKVGYAVMHHLMDRAAVVVPNCGYTGYEADLLVVTNDLRLVDVEIKIDRSDLKADLKKDKWWRAVTNNNKDGTTEGPFAPKIWKHYYVMPASVWDDKLYDAIPPTSGVVLIKEYPHTKSKLLMTVRRRATPNRRADKITPAAALAVARLGNLRMWDRIMTVESGPRRLGSVKVSGEYLRRIRSGEPPEPGLTAAMEGGLVIDIRHEFMEDCSVFTLWHKDFSEIAAGEVVPEYCIQVDGKKQTWKRVLS